MAEIKQEVADQKKPAQQIHTLMDLAHLFLIDLNTSETAEGRLESYEGREKGYTDALLQTYCYAFDQVLDGEINENFIRGLNKTAMAHVSPKSGIYKTGPNHFEIRSKGQQPAESKETGFKTNLTKKGFWELVDRWIVNEKEPILYIHIKPHNPSMAEMYLVPYNSERERGAFLQVVQPNGEVQEIALSDKNQTINGLSAKDFITKLLDFPPIAIKVNSLNNQQLKLQKRPKTSIENLMSYQVRRICANYNKKIKLAVTQRDKIAVIAEAAQMLDQAHVFDDGNVRGAEVFIQRMLHEIGEPLTLLADPNRLDGFSVEELVELIIEGQKRYKEVSVGKIVTFKDDYMSHPVTLKPKPISSPFANAFVQKVWIRNLTRTGLREETRPTISLGEANFFYFNDNPLLHQEVHALHPSVQAAMATGKNQSLASRSKNLISLG